MDNWTPEQHSLYRQLVAIIFGNLSPDMPEQAALDFAKARALIVVNDGELFPAA